MPFTTSPGTHAGGRPGPPGEASPRTSGGTRTVDRFRRTMRDLRISVTDRCNFRCTYCLPPEGARPVHIARSRLLSNAEITLVAKACAGLGVHKIRLTGGEPLLRRGLPGLIESLAGIEGIDDLALTTNGWFLAKQASTLAAAGLRRVTVSLDSLDEDVFGRMTGVGASARRVVAGIRAAQAAGLNPVKINTVVKHGVNEAGIVPLARFARQEGVILRLIEYMDVGQSGAWRRDDVVTAGTMIATVGEVFPLAVAESAPGAVAARYTYLDGGGELGVISAVSRPFCQTCTRLRLTADGQLYPCLFAERGHDLRSLLADDPSDELLSAAIARIWARREDRYSELRTSSTQRRGSVEMHRIGG